MSHFRLYPCLPLHRWIATTALLLPLACTDDGAPAEVMDTEGIELPTGGQSGDGLDESGTAADESGGLPGNCGAETFELQHEPTNVVLVLDKSYSMVDHSWDHDGDPGTEPVTRWNSLHGSVSFIVEEFDDGLNFGAVLFPAVDVPDNEWATACEVSPEPDAPVAPMGGEAVLAALPGPEAMDLYGGTPASGGITTALDHLDTLDDGLPQALRVHEAFQSEAVTVIGLHTVFEHHEVMGSPALQAFIHEYRLPFPIGIDQADETGPLPVTMSQWGLRGTPSIVLFDRQGRARLHRFGVVDDLVLGAAIGQLLAERPAVAAAVLPDRVGTGKARPACDGEGCVSQ